MINVDSVGQIKYITHINKQDYYHRIDAPAFIYPDGCSYYYEYGYEIRYLFMGSWHYGGKAMISKRVIELGEKEFYAYVDGHFKYIAYNKFANYLLGNQAK